MIITYLFRLPRARRHTGIGMHARKRGERNIKIKKKRGKRETEGEEEREKRRHKRRGGGLPVDPGRHVVL